MKLDIITLSNILHRLTVFDFSFLTLEAKYKQFLTVFVANNIYISLIFSKYIGKRNNKKDIVFSIVRCEHNHNILKFLKNVDD
jgi:hypothetical protein